MTLFDLLKTLDTEFCIDIKGPKQGRGRPSVFLKDLTDDNLNNDTFPKTWWNYKVSYITNGMVADLDIYLDK